MGCKRWRRGWQRCWQSSSSSVNSGQQESSSSSGCDSPTSFCSSHRVPAKPPARRSHLERGHACVWGSVARARGCWGHRHNRQHIFPQTSNTNTLLILSIPSALLSTHQRPLPWLPASPEGFLKLFYYTWQQPIWATTVSTSTMHCSLCPTCASQDVGADVEA